MGGEVRFAVLDEDAKAPASLALSASGYYMSVGDGPWARVGADLSIRLGSVAPAADHEGYGQRERQ
ncbi:hypothetical protein [Polyangium mundeleinium]|uniref:Uncharacterized protein n=1 Tax=Polyangium mundeleinium TaxID=2995306 RepID=A0ABT5EQT4_9BACT|nr:hypothetical protein [Polyangium mundeleinium]MDC0743125.1 hypothetical protein [Polyangium mundeleinium]